MISDQDRIINRYHQGQHSDCITCNHLRLIEDQAARIEALEAALRRIADPADECHLGYGGPWQDVAAAALALARQQGAGA